MKYLSLTTIALLCNTSSTQWQLRRCKKNIHFSEHVINSPNNPSNRMDCYANGKINALNAFSHHLHITPWLNVKTKDFIQGWLQYNCSVASSITSSLLQDQLHSLPFRTVYCSLKVLRHDLKLLSF